MATTGPPSAEYLNTTYPLHAYVSVEEGRVIARNLNISSVRADVSNMKEDDVCAFLESVFAFRHEFQDGVHIKWYDEDETRRSSMLDTALGRIRVGNMLVLCLVSVIWEPSTLQAVQHALHNSPSVRHVQLTLFQADVPSPTTVPHLVFPSHVTSATFVFDEIVHASLFETASFPGITSLVFTVNEDHRIIPGLVQGAFNVIQGAPLLQRITLYVCDYPADRLVTRVGSIWGRDITCMFSPELSDHVDSLFAVLSGRRRSRRLAAREAREARDAA